MTITRDTACMQAVAMGAARRVHRFPRSRLGSASAAAAAAVAVGTARRVHRFPRSRLGSALAAAVRFARHGAFTGFPDLGSARLRRQWCGLRGTARSQVSPISARLGSALAAAAAVAVGTARCSFIRPQRDHRAKYVSDKDGCDWSETYQYHAVSS